MDDGPSGSTSPAFLLERMRSELYRPGASASAVAAYRDLERVVDAERDAALRALSVAERNEAEGHGGPGGGSTAQRRHRRRSLALVIAVALAVGFAATTVATPPAPVSTVLRFIGPTPDVAMEEAAISGLFVQQFAARGGSLRRLIVVPPAALLTTRVPVVGRTVRVIGTRSISLTDLGGTAHRQLTVLVVCSAPGSYEWTLFGRGRGTSVRTRLTTPIRVADCARAATATTVDLGAAEAPEVRFTGSTSASTFVALALTQAEW